MSERRTPGWVCCFCYGSIPDLPDGERDEPVYIYARGARDEGEQALFSHLDCFKRALHPRIPVAVALHEAGDEPEDGEDVPD